jgi:MarR family
VPRPAGEPSLVINGRARRLRRSLGLTAWAALEELLLEGAPQAPGRLSTQASARVLAARLGVSKDTAAGALRRLASAGLVRREDHRDGARGVFACSVYVIDAVRLDPERHQTPDGTDSPVEASWRGWHGGGTRRRSSVVVRPGSAGAAVTASAEPQPRPANAPHQRTRDAANASTAYLRRPDRTTPGAPEPRTTQRRTAEPEQRRRHWHPAVPGVGAAVPAARRLVGGGRC